MDASIRPTVAQYRITRRLEDDERARTPDVPTSLADASGGRNVNATRQQQGGEAGVEAEELHARFARDEDEREDDADREVREEEKEDQLSAGRLFDSPPS